MQSGKSILTDRPLKELCREGIILIWWAKVKEKKLEKKPVEDNNQKGSSTTWFGGM